MERSFPRTIDALASIFEFVREVFAAEGIDPVNAFEVDLVIEELFTNMVKYSSDGSNDISIRIDRKNDRLIICLTDSDVDAFDPTRAREVDTGRPLKDRKPGGLGIHLVRRMTESFDYEYRDRTSIITLVKKLETQGA
jgi:serine/threonine-protein kinase RsbW